MSPNRTPRPRPSVIDVRLDALPQAVTAASKQFADFFGDAWQPGGRKPSRYKDSKNDLLRGKLLVDVPYEPEPPSASDLSEILRAAISQWEEHLDPREIQWMDMLVQRFNWISSQEES